MYKILLVEDDPVIANVIEKKLLKWDYIVHRVEDFENVLEDFKTFEPQLALIDITLPFFNGYHWLTEIRKISDIPVIFISSAGEDLNILMAMQLGADDYLTKPFAMEVMLAKIQAVLRRTYQINKTSSLLAVGDLTLKIEEMILIYKDSHIELTKNEFKILETLMRKRGEVVSREELMERLWQSDMYIDDNTLTVNVARLRKKLEEIGTGDIIKTKKGVGYYVKT
ncbi:MAG: response regulator transcription factor [Tissierellia bacterium]|nr:response regulator transcription factor [Tissierellia bacterium]